MAKRRTPATSTVRYKQKAFMIAKGMGLNDELAMEKAHKQTTAWISGRTVYGTISREVRSHLAKNTKIPSNFYGAFISASNWLYKNVVKKGYLNFEEAWNIAVKKFGLDKVASGEDLESVKKFLETFIVSLA